MKKYLFFLFIFSSFSIHSKELNKESLLLQCRESVGMFSVWMDVLTLCQEYEAGHLKGIAVDFENNGLYYDPTHGPNWWEYYCHPIKNGDLENIRKVKGKILSKRPGNIEFTITPEKAKHLIDKYIFIKPSILKQVEDFKNDHFKDKFVITVHYRGTDKHSEAPRTPYESVYKAILNVISKESINEFIIFLATDEIEILNYLSVLFGDRLCYQDAFRTTGKIGIHYMQIDKYQHGLECLIDMLLLSQGDHLIRTSSNLSKWSLWMNPDIKVTELSQRRLPIGCRKTIDLP